MTGYFKVPRKYWNISKRAQGVVDDEVLKYMLRMPWNSSNRLTEELGGMVDVDPNNRTLRINLFATWRWLARGSHSDLTTEHCEKIYLQRSDG